MVKHLFSDIDGTLLQKNKIDDDTILKIQKFVLDGNKFYMATGRIDSDIKYLENMLQVKCDYRISQNGTVINTVDNNIVYSNNIDTSVLKDITSYLFSIVDDDLRVEVSEIGKRYAKYIRPPSYFSEFSDALTVDFLLETKIGVSIFPTIFILISQNEELLEIIREYINSKFGNKVIALLTAKFCLEILNRDSSKGNAISFIIEKHNINKKDVYVVGDNENDISMFEQFENSFAMLNALPNVKQPANFIATYVGDVVDYIYNATDNLYKVKK